MSYVLKAITIDVETGQVNVKHVEYATKASGEQVIVDNHRSVLAPGDALCMDPNDKTMKPRSVVLGQYAAAMDAVWTPERLSAWTAK